MKILDAWKTVSGYTSLSDKELESALNKESDDFYDNVVKKPTPNLDNNTFISPSVVKKSIDDQLRKNKEVLKDISLSDSDRKLGEIHSKMLEKFSQKLNNLS